MPIGTYWELVQSIFVYQGKMKTLVLTVFLSFAFSFFNLSFVNGQYEGYCYCYLAPLMSISMKLNTSFIFSGPTVPISPTCDYNDGNNCLAYCEKEINEVTNDLDLTAVPKVSPLTQESLGQLLCRLNPNYKKYFLPINGRAVVECQRTGNWNLKNTHLRNTSKFSRMPLRCDRGQFILSFELTVQKW
jgi:hypothetical protein